MQIPLAPGGELAMDNGMSATEAGQNLIKLNWKMSNLTQVTKDTYTVEVEQADKLVVIDFFSPWCRPCKAMEPVLDEIAAERDDIKLVKVDASEEGELAQKFGVMGAPTFVALRNGEKIDMVSGLRSKEFMLDWIDKAEL